MDGNQDDKRHRSQERVEQVNAAVDFIAKRFPVPPRCPIDGSTSWLVTELLELFPVIGGTSPGSGYQVIQMFCSQCGYTLLFNATTVGFNHENVNLFQPEHPVDKHNQAPGSGETDSAL